MLHCKCNALGPALYAQWSVCYFTDRALVDTGWQCVEHSKNVFDRKLLRRPPDNVYEGETKSCEYHTKTTPCVYRLFSHDIIFKSLALLINQVSYSGVFQDKLKIA